MTTGRFLDRDTPPHLSTLVLVAAVSSVSMNIFLASLPAMAAYFDTTPAIMQYSISGYVFLSGVMQLAIGPLSDRYGRRMVLLISIAVFILASLGAIFAPNIESFMLCRVLQTSMVSGHILSRAIARDIVGATRSASLIGYITMGMALVPMVTPPIGGFLEAFFGWKASFLVQAGVAFGALLLVYLDLGETATRVSGGFSAQIRLFPELLRSRRVWGYSITGAFTAGVFFAYLAGAPFVAVDVYGMSPSQLGLYFSFAPLGYFIGNGLSGRYAVRVGMRPMVIAGTVVTALGMGMSVVLQLAGATHSLSFFGFTIFIGIGSGLALPSANAGILSVRPELAGAAAGLGGSLITLGAGAMSLAAGNLLAVDTSVMTLLAFIMGCALAAIIGACVTAWLDSRTRNPWDLRPDS
ncbi:MAG: multidrug effflux MFS transporter [Paracoccaceae bacterium]|nr:multidrug effflux MFS transporter [Paracoccaceae bacterium]MDE2913830.1 multidrug effflux MFS transporter [Paracoccaceae bacterium]